MASNNGGIEKFIEGLNQVQADAAAGGIHAKQAAAKALIEGAIRMSATFSLLSRQMSEPGSNYGPEITEPFAKAGEQSNAAAMCASQADSALTTLMQMSVGDLARSARQAPHHTELTESGAH